MIKGFFINNYKKDEFERSLFIIIFSHTIMVETWEIKTNKMKCVSSSDYKQLGYNGVLLESSRSYLDAKQSGICMDSPIPTTQILDWEQRRIGDNTTVFGLNTTRMRMQE